MSPVEPELGAAEVVEALRSALDVAEHRLFVEDSDGDEEDDDEEPKQMNEPAKPKESEGGHRASTSSHEAARSGAGRCGAERGRARGGDFGAAGPCVLHAARDTTLSRRFGQEVQVRVVAAAVGDCGGLTRWWQTASERGRGRRGQGEWAPPLVLASL